MYEENQASLALMDAGSQRNSQPCTVLMYDEENECIYLNPGNVICRRFRWMRPMCAPSRRSAARQAVSERCVSASRGKTEM